MDEVASIGPPSGANLGCGFDVISVAYEKPKGDIVRAKKSYVEVVRLVDIINTTEELPRDDRNVVVAVAKHLLQAARTAGIATDFFGIDLTLEKYMGIGTGMGSSASSSVAAAFSVNELLGPNKFGKNSQQMIDAVVHGEYVATKGKPHADNVLASLNGGFVMIHDMATYAHAAHPAGDNFYFVVVSPTNVSTNTGEARAALAELPYNIANLVSLTASFLKNGKLVAGTVPTSEVYMGSLVKKGGFEPKVLDYLAGTGNLVYGILQNDPEILGRGMMGDNIITPVRAEFIRAPGSSKSAFFGARDAALNAGAYGFTISGSGPTMVGVANNENLGCIIGESVQASLRKEGVESKVYVTKADNLGARRI